MRGLKTAFRTLLKTPFLTGVAILSLALGIGANAAIFSLFDEMLLRSLPVPNPGALVNLSAPGPKPGSQSCNMAGDCDAVFRKCLDGGATEVEPITDQFWGDRAGKLRDPFGHSWMIMTHKEDVSVEELKKRYDEMIEGMSPP